MLFIVPRFFPDDAENYYDKQNLESDKISPVREASKTYWFTIPKDVMYKQRFNNRFPLWFASFKCIHI